MGVYGFDFYNSTMSCLQPLPGSEALAVNGVSWHLMVPASFTFVSYQAPHLLDSIAGRVASTFTRFYEDQVCGLLMSRSFGYQECFYTSRSVCRILQSTIVSGLERWVQVCFDYTRAGLEAIANHTQPPVAKGECEAYQLTYPPVIEFQKLLGYLATKLTRAGEGPIVLPGREYRLEVSESFENG